MTRGISLIRQVFGKMGWGFADQALASLSNLGLGVFVARESTSREFGAFGLTFSAFLLALGISRALGTTPLMIRFSDVEAPVWRQGVSRAGGTVLVVGGLLGLVCASAGLLLPGALAACVYCLALFLPGLLLQDAWRFAFFSGGRGRSALVNDLVYNCLMFPGLLGLSALGESSAWTFIAVWGGAATVGALLGCIQAKVIPNFGEVLPWLRENRALGWRYLADFLAMIGASQLALFGIAGIAGLAAAGAFRGAQILLGPLNVVFLGVGLVAVPEGVRLVRADFSRFLAAARGLSISLAAAGVCWTLVVLIIGWRGGSQLLGSSWGGARSIVLPMGLTTAASGASMGAIAGLQCLAAARQGLRVRLIVAPLILAGGLLGALVGGVEAAAVGIAVATWVGVFIWWKSFRGAMHEHQIEHSRLDAVTGVSSDFDPAMGKCEF